MNPRDYYRKLSWEVDDEDVAALLLVLRDHIGKENKIDRHSLVEAMYGKYTDSLWRKMRMAKALLTKKVFSTGRKLAIGSSSGEGGYWIVKDETDREPCKAEHRSRKIETDDMLDNVTNGMTWEEVENSISNQFDDTLNTEYLQPALLEVPEPDPIPHSRW